MIIATSEADSEGIWLPGGAQVGSGVSTPVAGLLGQPNACPMRVSSNPATDVNPEFCKEPRVMKFLHMVRVPQARISDRVLTGL
jgi:hypothetical protein